ncbi:MAG: hypothetical protein GY711_15085 [bacterium]|nr:hypothetical protein [bacterium]
MSVELSAWLLLGASPSAHLRSFLEEHGLWSLHDFTPRPRASLELHGDEVVIMTSAPQRLVAALRRHGDVFTDAPGSVCAVVDRKRIQHEGRWFDIEWLGRNPRKPYDRRRLRFVQTATTPVDSPNDGGRIVTSEPGSDGWSLIVEPVHVTLTPDACPRLLAAAGAGAGAGDARVLPPTRRTGHPEYFAPERRRARAALAESILATCPPSERPSAWTLWRLIDDPDLIDTLCDGGAIHLLDEDNQASRLRLELFDAAPQSPEGYRAAVLDDGREPSRPVERVLRAVRGDVLAQLGAGAEMDRRARPVAWDVRSPVQRDEATGVDGGSWSYLASASAHIAEPERKRFDQLVLLPARPHGNRAPDNDLAERLLIAHLIRCPWSESTDLTAWREAVISILVLEEPGHALDARRRVERWAVDGWPRIVRPVGAERPVLEHRQPEYAEQTLAWRLQLPLGFVLRQTGELVWDDPQGRFDEAQFNGRANQTMQTQDCYDVPPPTAGDTARSEVIERWFEAHRLQASFHPDACHGLHRFELAASVRVRLEDTRLLLDVGDLSGVTPDWYPIELGASRWISGSLHAGETSELVFDAALRINRPSIEAEAGSDRLLELILEVADATSIPTFPRPSHLYLGRLRWHRADNRFEFVWRPTVRRLCALGNESEEQRDWTLPVRQRVQGWLEWIDNHCGSSSRLTAFLYHAIELKQCWRELLIPDLAERLARGAALKSAANNQGIPLARAVRAAVADKTALTGLLGEQQVAQLAELAHDPANSLAEGFRRLPRPEQVEFWPTGSDQLAVTLQTNLAVNWLELRLPMADESPRGVHLRCDDVLLEADLAREPRGSAHVYRVSAQSLGGSETLLVSGLSAHQRSLEVWVSEESR